MENQNKIFSRGILTLIAGVAIQLFNGCFFLWANIANYVLSYFYQFQPDIGQGSIFYVDAILGLVGVLGHQYGTYLLEQKQYSPRIIILGGGLVAVIGVFLSTFVHQFWLFLIFYGLLMGIGTGITYMVPLVCAYEYFPQKKGLVTGIIVGSYGLGSSIFNILATKIVNPDDESTQIHSKNDENLSFFGPNVANRVPKMFRILSIIWLILTLISFLLISRPSKKDYEPIQTTSIEMSVQNDPNTLETQVDDQPPRPQSASLEPTFQLTHPYDSLKSANFWQYTFMMLASNVFGGFFSYQYKIIGNSDPTKNNDLILSEAASASGVVQFVTRLAVGTLYDRLGFNRIFIPLMAVNVVNAVVCYHVREILWLYVICIELNYVVLAGVFALFPAPVIKTFGSKYGPQVYTMVLLGAPASSVLDIIGIKIVYENFGETPILLFGAAMSFLAIIVALNFNEDLDIQKMENLGHIEWNNQNSKQEIVK